MKKAILFSLTLLCLSSVVSAIGLLKSPDVLTINTAHDSVLNLSVRGDSVVHEGVFFVQSNSPYLKVNGDQVYDRSMSLAQYELKEKSVTVSSTKAGNYVLTWGYEVPSSGAGQMDSVVQKSINVVVECTVGCNVDGSSSGSSSGSSGSSSRSSGGGGGGGFSSYFNWTSKKFVNVTNSTESVAVPDVEDSVDEGSGSAVADVSGENSGVAQTVVTKEEGNPVLAKVEENLGIAAPNKTLFYSLFGVTVVAILFTVFVIRLTKEARS